MHLVLRSTQAKNQWRFLRFESEIQQLITKFANKNYIHIISVANVGNHLHIHLRVRGRHYFKAFIRALTAAIMMRVTGFNRWNPAPKGFRFWDNRTFTRIISTCKEFLNLKAYIEVNQWEGLGYSKDVSGHLRRIGAISAGAG